MPRLLYLALWGCHSLSVILMVVAGVTGFLRLPFIPFKRVSVGTLVLLVQLFLWISADAVYGAFAEAVREVMLIYFIMFALGWVGQKIRPLQFSTGTGRETFTNFLFIFVITAAILLPLTATGIVSGVLLRVTSGQFFFTAGAITITGLGFGALLAFVKAWIEESIFRDLLPRIGFGDIASNILFGVFHLSILITFTIPGLITQGVLVDLGANNFIHALAPVLVLTTLGFVWARVRNGWGIAGATASHTVWNLFSMNALGIVFGGIA